METDIDRAFAIIHRATLKHPDRPLLECYLQDAKDPNRAARCLLKRCENDRSDSQLAEFLHDWKTVVKSFYIDTPRCESIFSALTKTILRRDKGLCCILPTRNRRRNPCLVYRILTWIRNRLRNPCHVYPILPWIGNQQGSQRPNEAHAFQIPKGQEEILEAFLSAEQRRVVFDPNRMTKNWNYWTLSLTAARAFARGEFRLEHQGTTKYEVVYNGIGFLPAYYTINRMAGWYCDLDDHSQSGIESPDPTLLETHRQFSKALQWNHIADNMSTKFHHQPIKRSTFSIGQAANAVWQLFPAWLRVHAYKIMRTIGSYLYDADALGVQRIPFGMYLKYGPEYHEDRHRREFDALKIVRNRTSIPVPRAIDLVKSASESFLVTSRIAGERAGKYIYYYSDEEKSAIVQDLQELIAELRAISKPSSLKYAISDASGESCLDYRIDSSPVGPFSSEKEFSESLCLGILPGLIHRDDHKIVFTHGDLNMRNILVKDMRIVGIVDWENAGWFPEYWEYTKCNFSVRRQQRWLGIIDEVFGGNYKEELEIEKQYWEYHSL